MYFDKKIFETVININVTLYGKHPSFKRKISIFKTFLIKKKNNFDITKV